MGLRDYVLPTTTIPLPDTERGEPNSLTVRGLAFADFVLLGNNYGPQVALAFNKFAGGGTVSEEEVKTAMMAILPELGTLPGAVIALAADEFNDKTVVVANRLPLEAQVAAFEAIFTHTIGSESRLKKFVESILRAITFTAETVAEMRLPISDSGSGA